MNTATLSSKGQITLPVGLRAKLGLKAKDRLSIDEENGAIVIRKAPDLMQFAGFLGKRLPREEERKRMVEYLVNRGKEKK